MDRFDRSRRFFGDEGLAALQRQRVAVVGTGGIGSPLILQLAYHGVGSISAIDHDRADVTSRNRLVGLWADDPNNLPKVEIAARLVKLIAPSTLFVPLHERLNSPAARAAILSSDWVFGCLDEDGARLQLTEICCQHGLSYVDMATDVHVEDAATVFGGRVCISTDDTGCPYCLDLLDQRSIDLSLASPEERAQRDEIYGVHRGALGGAGPAVVNLNTLIASLGVTEFVAAVTGLRRPRRVLTYRGDLGVVLASEELGEPGCYYCDLRHHGASRGSDATREHDQKVG